MSLKIKHKELIKTELANSYGGWIYCENCKQTIGYLCYVTYGSFKLEYTCNCGNNGSMEIVMEDCPEVKSSNSQLIKIKNRLCCCDDESPLVTILSKKLSKYSCEVVCKACGEKYKEEGKL